MASRDRLAPSASGLLSEKGKQIGPSGPSRRKKVMALLALTVQNAVYALIIKYSRTAPRAHGGHYLASSVVVVTEIAKAIVALGLLQWETGKAIPLLIANDWKQSYLFAFPATVYTVQNNLSFYAMKYLDAPTFMVLSQAKILTTAVFTVLLLGRRLHRVRWNALMLLTAGVVLVQHTPTAGPRRSASRGEYTAGVLSVLGLSTCSGLAAVYQERVMKGRVNTNIQVFNIQLAIYGAAFGSVAMLLTDGPRLRDGLFQGYTVLVWWVVFVSAVGGLLVAYVVRHLDSIMKNFAATASIVVSTAVSIPLFGFAVDMDFAVGSLVVALSILLYTEQDVVDPPPRRAARGAGMGPVPLEAVTAERQAV